MVPNRNIKLLLLLHHQLLQSVFSKLLSVDLSNHMMIAVLILGLSSSLPQYERLLIFYLPTKYKLFFNIILHQLKLGDIKLFASLLIIIASVKALPYCNVTAAA